MTQVEARAVVHPQPPAPDPGAAGDSSRVVTMRRGLVLAACAVAVIGLEALAYSLHGPFEWAAARLWALGGCGFVVVGVVAIARAAAGAIRDRCLLSLIMVPVVGFVTLWGISGVEHVQIQHEATQQIADGLTAFQQPGWNYTGVGFLGYPNRQYLINAVPSLLLGRGLTALRLGFALPFLFGAGLFWAGAREEWRRFPDGGALAALATLSVLAFPYAIDHLRWFEQTDFPLAATLAAAGWLLITRRRPTVPALLGLGWIGALLGCSYTPSLASAALLAAISLWLAATAWRQVERGLALGWIAVASITLGLTALSFLTRVDLFKGSAETTLKSELAAPLREAFAIFLFGVPKLFLPPVLFLPIMAVLLLGLVGRLRLAGFAIAWWTVAVIVTGTAFSGYADPPPSFGMHRAIIVIPPLLLLAGWWGLHAGEARGVRAPRAILAVMTVLVVGQVAWNLAALDRDYLPSIREAVFSDMLEQGRRLEIATDSRPTVVLLTSHGGLDNAEDFLTYFYPSHRLVRSVEEAAAVDPRTDPVFVYADADTWSAGSLPWLDGLDSGLIELRDGDSLHRMVRWASSPAGMPAGDASSRNAPVSER